MGNELFDAIQPDAWHVAHAIELFHNFTLIHDDIMDKAPLRRGVQTVHVKYNEPTALLAGDVMIVAAYEYLSRINPLYLPKIMHLFNKTAREVCEGQQLDMDFEERQEVTLEEYMHMVTLKTSVLLAASLQMGAMLGGSGGDNQNHLYAFGKNLGIAFQLQDDLLDTYGDPTKFGKQVGGDILQNKKTLLVLKALETASEADRLELSRRMQTGAENPDEKVAAVRAIFDRNNIPGLILAEKQRFQEEAFAHLQAVQVAEERKAVIRQMIEELLVREF